MAAYIASARQNLGRKGWLVDFRHPLRRDNSGNPGRKTRKGLGTTDQAEAEQLVKQLNELLADQAFHSIGARQGAATRFDPRVVEIFYSEIAPKSDAPRQVREELLPLPTRDQGYVRAMLIGVPGAGKTTLLRQMIGSHPKKDRFPATSVNRTTTFPTEIFFQPNKFEAVVSFMSEHETRFEVEECLSSAILEAVEGSRADVARALLEKSDMRFRLKYLLGGYSIDDANDDDPYAEELEPELDLTEEGISVASPEEIRVFNQRIEGYLEKIISLATKCKQEVEAVSGSMQSLSAEDKNAALDLIQEQANDTNEFVELVSDVVDELRSKFEIVDTGRYERTTTGWPRAWQLSAERKDRTEFIRSLRFFAGIAVPSWGKLLTPLVNGMRVAGPFKPDWTEHEIKLVLVDTEGLFHKASANVDLPDQVVMMLDETDVVLLVDSAKNAMTNFAAGKALEAIVNTGHTNKLMVAFTHMDAVSGENLKGRTKFEHVFAGIRNVVENQVAKSVSIDAARHLMTHIQPRTFYLGKLDNFEAKPALPELRRLFDALRDAEPEVFEPVSFPEYKVDQLILAIQEAARMFRMPWRGILGLETHSEERARHWQTIKALSRRYAEGWDDGFPLQPASNLIAAWSAAISRFLESPISWSGTPTVDQKREIIDRIKALVTAKLPGLANSRLREKAQANWNEAFMLRGAGSTLSRRIRIEGIYERWVPIPDSRGDREVQESIDEIKATVTEAIEIVEKQATALQQTL